MPKKIMGFIVIGELLCDNCGKTMRHPEMYALVCDEDKEEGKRFCADCSRKKGYLKMVKTDWGAEIESFL